MLHDMWVSTTMKDGSLASAVTRRPHLVQNFAFGSLKMDLSRGLSRIFYPPNPLLIGILLQVLGSKEHGMHSLPFQVPISYARSTRCPTRLPHVVIKPLFESGITHPANHNQHSNYSLLLNSSSGLAPRIWLPSPHICSSPSNALHHLYPC
jgi:hypothetical protein